MALELVSKGERSLVPNTDAVEQIFDDLAGLLRAGSNERVLVSFASEGALQRTRRQLLEWASEGGWLLYEEPIPSTLDREFYLEEDDED